MGIINRFEQIRKRSVAKRVLPSASVMFKNALLKSINTIPVVVISYNNYIYIRNTIIQLKRFNIVPIIIDNKSEDKQTVEFLRSIEKDGSAHVVFCDANMGHMIGFYEELYSLLPDVFAYTDPDLQFSTSLPENFLDILSELTIRYSTFKAGLALDLEAGDIPSRLSIFREYKHPIFFEKRYSVRDWESRFWRMRLSHENLEIYAATIDTTFAVYRKSNYNGDFMDAVRVAGSFSAIHLPWYPEFDIMSPEQRDKYVKKNISTTWSGISK